MQENVMALETRLRSMDPGGMEEAKARASREITAARADVKRMESRCNKAGEDASRAITEITELSTQTCRAKFLH